MGYAKNAAVNFRLRFFEAAVHDSMKYCSCKKYECLKSKGFLHSVFHLKMNGT